MGTKLRLYILILVSMLGISLVSSEANAFWIWTPESNKWVNPKYAVKDTPMEQLEYSLSYYQEKDYQKAIEEFKKLIKHYPRSKEAGEAQYYIGMAQEEQGQIYKAFKSYQLALEKYPFSDRAPDIVKRQYDIGGLMLEGKSEQNKFVKIVVGGDYDVIEVFRTVIKNAPYGEYAAPSQYKIGLYLQEKQLYQEARDEFEKTINDYPDTEWAKAAKYQIALADANRSADAGYDQQITESAVEEFKEFVKIYPDAELSKGAQDQIQQLREKEAENNFIIGEFYEKHKKYKAAKVYYNTVVESYRNTTWAAKALAKIRELNRLTY